MKKTTKLVIKKVTLRNLDEFTLDAVAGGAVVTEFDQPTILPACPTVPKTCIKQVCA